jgi:hypothetical protein
MRARNDTADAASKIVQLLDDPAVIKMGEIGHSAGCKTELSWDHQVN